MVQCVSLILYLSRKMQVVLAASRPSMVYSLGFSWLCSVNKFTELKHDHGSPSRKLTKLHSSYGKQQAMTND